MASLTDVAPGSQAVGGLGGAGAGDDSEGGGGHNAGGSGPAGHRDAGRQSRREREQQLARDAHKKMKGKLKALGDLLRDIEQGFDDDADAALQLLASDDDEPEPVDDTYRFSRTFSPAPRRASVYRLGPNLRPGKGAVPGSEINALFTVPFLHQSASLRNTHIGSRFDLSTPAGIEEALADLGCVSAALVHRLQRLQRGAPVLPVLQQASPVEGGLPAADPAAPRSPPAGSRSAGAPHPGAAAGDDDVDMAYINAPLDIDSPSDVTDWNKAEFDPKEW